jgi:uncharacterized protein (DUF1015 family)
LLRIRPFAAIRPAVNHESRVASPPYDVVTTAEARAIAAGNPECFLHVVRSEIDLPEGTDPYSDVVYEAAKRNLQRLLRDGILVTDREQRMFLYRQVWNHKAQVGLVCCCHVQDYENNIILRHEKTRRVKEDDRTRHVLAVNANTGPVFLAYRDQPSITRLMREDMNARPLYHFVAPDGVTHTVWPVNEADSYVRAFQGVAHAYVADGHHRAASAARAAAHRRSTNPSHRGDEEYNWFLAALFPASELRILPYHRIVRRHVGCVDDVRDALIRRLGATPARAAEPDRAGVCCAYAAGQWLRIEFDPPAIQQTDPIASLDVSLLQERILKPIFGIEDPRTDERIDFVGGIRGTAHLEELVDSGAAAAAFSLFPTSMEQLMAVSDAGLIMPPKSTWFEPKLRSGLLVHSLD